MSRANCLSKQECDNVCYLINEILGIYNELIVTKKVSVYVWEILVYAEEATGCVL